MAIAHLVASSLTEDWRRYFRAHGHHSGSIKVHKMMQLCQSTELFEFKLFQNFLQARFKQFLCHCHWAARVFVYKTLWSYFIDWQIMHGGDRLVTKRLMVFCVCKIHSLHETLEVLNDYSLTKPQSAVFYSLLSLPQTWTQNRDFRIKYNCGLKRCRKVQSTK